MPITSANALECASKSHAQRKLNRAHKELLFAALDSSGLYVLEQLALTRTEIERVRGLLTASVEPIAIERLSRALKILSDRERELDGRPTPGQLRPAKEAATRQPSKLVVSPV